MIQVKSPKSDLIDIDRKEIGAPGPCGRVAADAHPGEIVIAHRRIESKAAQLIEALPAIFCAEGFDAETTAGAQEMA
ncbi:hypothetical protein [Inquilinus sp. OTU3971]|uniref:hypothetical protein n=1 Tax=Inquilinus sp. OTU3971 TaxID=3043855 RepID=UPI00313CFE29